MSYDLRRLRLHGLIDKIPRTNTYRTTPDGIRAAVFYTKLRARLLGPLLDSANQPPAPIELRRALATIDRTIDTSSKTPTRHRRMYSFEVRAPKRSSVGSVRRRRRLLTSTARAPAGARTAVRRLVSALAGSALLAAAACGVKSPSSPVISSSCRTSAI